MMLEVLANELLLELFEYFDAIELFRAFHNLNSRFHVLLLTHFRAYRLNFHFVRKYQSGFLWQQYLAAIVDRILSLRLSDNEDESGRQTDLFSTSGLQFNQFIQLRSLSLCDMDTRRQLLQKLIEDCRHHLPHLTHLKVIERYSHYICSLDCSNTIWNLPKLTHCYLSMKRDFSIPTVISTSLIYVSISCESWGLNQTIGLLQQTPCLQFLRVPLNDLNDEHQSTAASVRSMTKLKLTDVRSHHAMTNILQIMPNLTYLKVDTHSGDCHGYYWEELIDNHLRKLKTFCLRMHLDFTDEQNNDKRLDQLIDSFRTPFWLEKHQWYIRCHYKSSKNHRNIILYTIPYQFIELDSNMLNMPFQTTDSNDANHSQYERVTNLSYTLTSSTDCSSLMQFSSIRSLSIVLNFIKNFSQHVPLFDQLTSMTVLSSGSNASLRLQCLLDLAPRLHSLTIHSWPFAEVPLVKNTSASLRRLDLRSNNNPKQIFPLFNDRACRMFIQSPLSRQCEELLIKVENHENILHFIHGMPNLRMLHIQSQTLNDLFVPSYSDQSPLSWIKKHLPSTCQISDYGSFDALWIYLDKPLENKFENLSE